MAAIKLSSITVLYKLTATLTADRHENDHDILQRGRQGIFQDGFQHTAALAQAQVLQQRFHNGDVAGIADAAIVQHPNFAAQALAKRAEAARRIECLVADAVERELDRKSTRLNSSH